MKCPRCQGESVVKRGKHHSSSQRYLYKAGNRHFTPQPNPTGYPLDIRRQAVEMDLDGHSFRRIGRNLRVNSQSVASWVKCAGGRALAAPIPQPPTDDDTVVKLDELFTFVGSKKRVYLITQVERRRALCGELVDTLSRDEAVLQAVVDQAPRAFQYCIDGFSGYAALDYRGDCLWLRRASRRPIRLKLGMLSCGKLSHA
ncbi:MAG: hypothetical protein NZM18_02185 [Thermoflexales bacterium]|nr:hypothetical protein [Thermoflexales bacterium]